MSVAAMVIAAVVSLASCTSSGTSAQKHSGTNPSAASHRGVVVYLCAKASQAPCTGRTTAKQAAAIGRRLHADRDISSVRYRSERAQYRAAKKRLPQRAAKLLRLGDLPAAFVVDVRSPGRIAAVVSRYRHLPGVSAVRPCGNAGC